MYNLYTYEKQLLQDEKEKNELIKRNKLKKKRKKELIKLSKNYDDRMNDFILTMCQNPILLYKKENPYKDYSKKNHFIFGDFKTDKERIESLEKEKKILQKYEEKREKDEKNRNILKIKNHRNLMIIQPKMRFSSRTKLENIIEMIKKKEENANIDIYNSSVMEQIKRLKYNDVKKIKEYYNLIDKDKLNNKDLKRVIKYLNEKEQCENTNKYTLKNYLEWKYHGVVYDNERNKNKNKSHPNLNYNKLSEILELIGNKNNIKEEKNNEFECLVKDDFKTHFKGASQYIELRELKDNFKENRYFTIKNNIQDEIQNIEKTKSLQKRAMSALKLTTNNKSRNHFLSENKSHKNTNNNDNYTKKETKQKMKKRPASVIVSKLKGNDYKFLMNKNEYSLKDLSETFKMKKIMMKNMMNKEINNSIMNHYINKYVLIKGIEKLEDIYPKSILLQYNNNLNKNEENKEQLEEKFYNLKEEISRQKRIKNKDRYNQFVKRFAKSTYGLRKKEIMEKMEDFQEDKKSDFVVIDGKVFKKNDMKNITHKIFKKCNYLNSKSEFNEGSLVKNNGKLMFTSGLTVNDFSLKFNL